ncbi:hypothetical protein JCM8097_004211 [Rhodosporidiobolus ruineniae]
MPTPRTPPSSRPAFSLLPRLDTAFSSSSSPSSSHASPNDQSVPLLFSRSGASTPVRGHSPGPVSPSSPSPGGAAASGGGASVSSPSAPFGFVPPPKAARLGGSSRRWAILAALLVVGGLVASGGGFGAASGAGAEEQAVGLREKWGERVEGWRTAWSGSGTGGGGAKGEEPPGGKTAAKEGAVVDLGADDADEPPIPPSSSSDDAGDQGGARRPKYEEDDLSLTLGGAGEEDEQEPPVSSTSPSSSVDDPRLEQLRLNVRPVPRPPPRNPKVASEMKYMSFENHSGFHNQRKSLVNALTLAQLLNRTLLLSPARLGSPIPWGPDVNLRLTHSERCKAGLEADPIASTTNSPRIGESECDDPSKWTYVGWEYLVSPLLLEGRAIVDRWNSSSEWFFASLEEGGLGLREDEVRAFDDPERRSYQIYDARATPTDTSGLFKSRLDLEDLREDPARLLRFGSLFSGARLKLSSDENKQVMIEANENVILRSEGLDAISDKVRDLLGSYVAVHARVGDGVFKTQAKPNMQKVFRRLAHNVLGLTGKVIDQLLAEADSPLAAAPAVKEKKKLVARQFGSPDPDFLLSPPGAVEEVIVGEEEEEGDHEEEEEDERDAFPSFILSPPSSRLSKRSLPSSFSSPTILAKRSGPSRPLSPTLHCRSPLHPSLSADGKPSKLAPLNTPLYIATDARDPPSDPALRPFFRWFPCVFLLNDFAEPSSPATQGEETVRPSEEPLPELEALVDAADGDQGSMWVSEWDGQAMARYLYPFLEAEIAARGVEVVGTPSSTFSGYTAGILHESYVAQGLVAGWDLDP